MRRITWLLVAVIVALGAVSVGGRSAQPTTGAAASTRVVRAAFYYPWFPGAWTQLGITPYTNYHPSEGFYSSNDPALVRRQVAAMQYAHLDAGIISWWGQGSREDKVVPTDLAAAAGTGFTWSLYYEPEGIGNPSVAQLQSDLSYIKARYASDPNYLTIDGRPALFVYADGTDGCDMASRWQQANATEGFYTVLKVFSGFRTCASDASSWHQYGPAVAESHQAGYSFTISPGFSKAGEASPRLARDPTAWRTDISDMVASKEPLQLVTTFNEWGEGTAVESAQEWATASGHGSYLDALHDGLPAPPPVTTGTLGSSVVGMAARPDGLGYWLADAAGAVSAHGAAHDLGSMAGQALNSPITHIVATPDGLGYWLVAGDGGTFAFGDAGFYGSMGAQHLNAPVVDIAPTADGRGYWLVASDGGIFAFGDARFQGSMGGTHLNRPVVGIATDDTTGGYWLVASDGGIFAFGAPFRGSTGDLQLARPVNGMTAAPDDQGYWFVASDGGVFAFGSAPFRGSAGGGVATAPVMGMAADPATVGYWLVDDAGRVYAYDAPDYGSH